MKMSIQLNLPVIMSIIVNNPADILVQLPDVQNRRTGLKRGDPAANH